MAYFKFSLCDQRTPYKFSALKSHENMSGVALHSSGIHNERNFVRSPRHLVLSNAETHTFNFHSRSTCKLMAPKKRRRAWESASVGDDDAEDVFGIGRALKEDREIEERRARLKIASRNVERTGPDTAPLIAPDRGQRLSTDSRSLLQVSNGRSKDERTVGCLPPAPVGDNDVSSAPIENGQRAARTTLAPKNDRELRAALLQLRDAAADGDGPGVGLREALGAPTGASQPKNVPVYDMFADTPGDGTETGLVQGHGLSDRENARVRVPGLDDPADEEGYARLQLDELLADGLYVAGPAIGQGVFASVYRATARETGACVAVKVLRNNDVMRRAGRHEVDTLRRIAEADPQDRRHCVRIIDHFDHHGHVVIVFEELAMNLREVIKKYGGGGGIRLEAVRLYASQLLSALHFLGQLGIVHADIKPDNTLLSEDKRTAKLCDFGSAMLESSGETDATPYLVSRFYRAPEVVLGVLPYGRALDVWSLGCVLFELYTGKIAFPGRSNNDMLRLVHERRGCVPMRMLKRASFRADHFDERGYFLHRVTDDVSGAVVVREEKVPERPPRHDVLRDAVLAAALDEDDERQAALLLADVLDGMLTVDPVRRISAAEALKMPFFVRVAP
jgi:serine/threonine-protein kinase PRP4